MITENALQIFGVVYVVVSLLIFIVGNLRDIKNKNGSQQITVGNALFVFGLCFFPFVNLIILWDLLKVVFEGFFSYVIWERKEEIQPEEQNDI